MTQPTKLTNTLPSLGCRIHCCKHTGLVYVSSQEGISIFQGGRLLYTIRGGPVMAFSPSGKYIVTDGGVYRAQEPFNLLVPLSLIMDDAAFGSTDNEFIILSVGCLVGYRWIKSDETPRWTQQYDIYLGEPVRQIVYSDSKWAILNANGRLSVISDNIDYDPEERVHIIEHVWPRECWTGNVRLLSENGYIVIASDQTLWMRKWEDIHEIEYQVFHDGVPVNSALHDRIVYRDSCRVGDNIYRISRCGNFLLQIIYTPIVPRVVEKPTSPPKEPVVTVSKTGREYPSYGVMTRNQYKAFIALKSTRH